jgi:hypothetical protein
MAAVQFRLEQRFAAHLRAVEDAFVDPEVLAHLAGLPGLGRPELLDRSEDGSLVRQRVRYRFEGHLSHTVTSVVDPARLTWVEESALDRRTHETEVLVLPDHYADRLRCRATVVLAGVADGVTRVTEGDLRVRAPLLASRVERAIVAGLHDHVAAQSAAVQAWLDGDHR